MSLCVFRVMQDEGMWGFVHCVYVTVLSCNSKLLYVCCGVAESETPTHQNEIWSFPS
jgi:hypothetical protein